MSLDSIKSGMVTLLGTIGGINVVEQYAEDRITRSEGVQIAVVWAEPRAMREVRIAGGVGGLKRRIWPMHTTLLFYSEVTTHDSEGFDDLLNSVQLAYAGSINLGGNGDVANVSKVLKFAEENTVVLSPPTLDGDLNEWIRYEADITAMVYEAVNA